METISIFLLKDFVMRLGLPMGYNGQGNMLKICVEVNLPYPVRITAYWLYPRKLTIAATARMSLFVQRLAQLSHGPP